MKQLPGRGKPPPGQRGKKRHPKAVSGQDEHDWSRDAQARGQPAWLDDGDGKQVCRKCGIERKTNPLAQDINADHAGFDPIDKQRLKGKEVAQLHTYIDGKGRRFQTTMELGCPMLLIDEMGAIRENRQMIRNVDDRVDHTDDRVDDVEERVEGHEERLARLEAENAALRERINQPIDVTVMVDWLSDMVALAAAQKLKTVQVQLEDGRRAALPPPVAEFILDVAAIKEPEEADT